MNDVEKFFYHLEIKPYLDLGIIFDPSSLLQEIEKYKEEFYHHRLEDQDSRMEGRWKAFSLQGNKPGETGEFPLLRNGPLRDFFPKTLELLDRCIKTDEATRIRYMMMEPHSKILPHHDSPDGGPRYTFHATITYPENCRFLVGLDAKGEKTPFTHEVPFAPGKVFLINASKVHSIINDSDGERVHLAALAVPKLSVTEMLKLAEIQNGVMSEEELIKRYAKVKIASS